ncbi:MAG TPA: Hsp70 family protein, partial [Candidatus Latescibacteria bacterium]|nr:Hsp70 family protein [Candidatus Latescibacterota bacterium]
TTLIERNTTIPTRKSQIFSTATDGQPSVRVHVLQGERAMAAENRTLATFDLVGIPPAPRGVPQIEVTFDIDANGIVHVTAKDLGTGKEQKIKVEVSSGLSKQEIDRMVKDAEAHRDEDQKQRELIELRNQADSFVYQAEKNLKEYGDKVDASEREKIQTAIDGVKSVQNGSDAGAIRSAIETLQQAMMKLGEVMYQQTAGGAGGPGPEGAQPGTGSAGGPQSGSAGGPVDAEFTVEDDDKKNS